MSKLRVHFRNFEITFSAFMFLNTVIKFKAVSSSQTKLFVNIS